MVGNFVCSTLGRLSRRPPTISLPLFVTDIRRIGCPTAAAEPTGSGGPIESGLPSLPSFDIRRIHRQQEIQILFLDNKLQLSRLASVGAGRTIPGTPSSSPRTAICSAHVLGSVPAVNAVSASLAISSRPTAPTGSTTRGKRQRSLLAQIVHELLC